MFTWTLLDNYCVCPHFFIMTQRLTLPYHLQTDTQRKPPFLSKVQNPQPSSASNHSDDDDEDDDEFDR